jgi:hypothetical protein
MKYGDWRILIKIVTNWGIQKYKKIKKWRFLPVSQDYTLEMQNAKNKKKIVMQQLAFKNIP